MNSKFYFILFQYFVGYHVYLLGLDQVFYFRQIFKL